MLRYLMRMVKHFQSSQNIRFTVSLQYLQKQVRDEVDFLQSDKHQSFLQFYFSTLGINFFFYTLILSLMMGMVKLSQSTQNNKFNLYNISKKKLGRSSGFVFRLTSKFLQAGIILMEVARQV